MRFIGDVHGKFSEYKSIIDDCEKSIQVGDFGVGFGGIEPVESSNHRFIRGNHDSPKACAKRGDWILDGTTEGDMYFLGGARSSDQAYRTEGVSWWRDEELSQERMMDISGKFYDGELKPKIMVTHDIPWSVALKIFAPNAPWLHRERGSSTQQFLDSIFEYHKPDLHIFGHWHEDKDVVIDGTRFICLAELSYIDVDLGTLEVKKG